MEGETSIISSKDILSTELHKIDMMAVNFSARWGEDTKYRIAFTTMIRHLRRLLDNDIKNLDDANQKEFEIPTKQGFEDYDGWEQLHTNLWGLARKLGHTGTEEKNRDFAGMINTLKNGVIPNE